LALLVTEDDAEYETLTIRALRVTAARAAAKQRLLGWELVTQKQLSILRTEMTFRRVKKKLPKYVLPLAIGGPAVVLAGIVALAVGVGSSQPTAVDGQQPTVATASSVPSATPHAIQFTDGDPGDPTTVTSAADSPSVAIADSSVTDTTAMALLATIPIKGRAPKTGYNRTNDFGIAWLDVDRNGCDTRNDILSRDLQPEVKEGTCKVLSGVLADPYTGGTMSFVRGETTSALVQIDHIVALADAWQTGAQQLTQAQRISLANDPLNLLAVDAQSNAQKGDGDTATWLPSNKSFRCSYVSHQVSVKATYGLWVTQAEHDAMVRVLSDCSGERAFTSPFASAPTSARSFVTVPAPAAQPAAPAPAPAAPAPAVPAPAPAGVVHPGAFCSGAGSTGVTSTGKPMVCKTSSTDTRLRWRAA
jgi:hypothetical protein